MAAAWKRKSCSIPQLDVSLYRVDRTDIEGRPIESYINYNGPAAYGPRGVRRGGPYWRGEVSRQYATMLLHRARSRGLRVVCDGVQLAGRR